MEKLNKKGFILSGAFVILILATIGIIAFLSSSMVRFTVIGAGIIALTVYLSISKGIESKITKQGFIIILIFLVLGVVIMFIPKMGLLQMTAFETGYFEAPFFGTIQCSPAVGGSATSGDISIPETGSVLVSCPVNTKNCDIWLNERSDTQIWINRDAFYKVCNRDGSGCGVEVRQEDIAQAGENPWDYLHQIFDDLPVDKALEVRIQECSIFGCSDDEDLNWKINIVYVPYILWQKDSLNSGITPISGSTDCKMPTYKSEWLDRIISSDVMSKLGGTADTEFETISLNNQLAPDEAYNYISGTVTRAFLGNAIEYNGETAYCIDNEQGTGRAGIYSIGIIESATNKYSIVDMNDRIGEEDCCIEGSIQLNRICEDFTWTTVNVDSTTGKTDVGCSITRPCPAGKLPTGEISSYEFDCIDNFCVMVNIQVEECNDQTDCLSDEVCINFQCESAGTVAGATPVKDEEVIIDSQSECLAQNGEGSNRYQWIEKIDYPFYQFWKTDQPAYCKDTYSTYFILGGVAVFIFAIILTLLLTNKKGVSSSSQSFTQPISERSVSRKSKGGNSSTPNINIRINESNRRKARKK